MGGTGPPVRHGVGVAGQRQCGRVLPVRIRGVGGNPADQCPYSGSVVAAADLDGGRLRRASGSRSVRSRPRPSPDCSPGITVKARGRSERRRWRSWGRSRSSHSRSHPLATCLDRSAGLAIALAKSLPLSRRLRTPRTAQQSDLDATCGADFQHSMGTAGRIRRKGSPRRSNMRCHPGMLILTMRAARPGDMSGTIDCRPGFCRCWKILPSRTRMGSTGRRVDT